MEVLVDSLLEAGGHSRSNRMMRALSEDHAYVIRICQYLDTVARTYIVQPLGAYLV